MAVDLPPLGPLTANHPVALVVNPDASRFFAVAGNGGLATHGRCDRGGSFDSVGPRRVVPDAALPAHSHRRSKSGHDRNNCR
jgi:hypothetical protein